MALTFIDSHCHFDFEAFAPDREAVWGRCQDLGLRRMIVPGVSPAQWSGLSDLCQKYPGLYYAAGVHPWWLEDVKNTAETWTRALETSAQDPNCVAVGECGLDFARDIPSPDQESVFEKHLVLANDLDLPLIIHCVKAHNPLLRLLKAHRPRRGGVIHAFSGSLPMAEAYWSLGFYLGVGGVITYTRARKTRDTLRQMPIEALLLETDAPDMPLSGHQGERNSPTRIPDIAHALADLRGETLEQVAAQTTTNSQRLFGL